MESRSHHFASRSSSSRTRGCDASAVARNASMQLWGKGQGCDLRYRTEPSSTTTPVSSSTSRATALSSVSPASQNPASVVIMPAGCRGDRARRILELQRELTAMIAAGSDRGNVSAPLVDPLRAWPALCRIAGPPSTEQKPERRCHVAMAVAASATWFSVGERNGACVRVSRKRESSRPALALTAKSGAPPARPRKAIVVPDDWSSIPKASASASSINASAVSDEKSARPPSQTT
mmetsp:Transcript_9553/g.29753  ORF Transcript_9553/g.29753 Transcript_9553/m.29753 type:complete len:235 (-) Transcript_9553:193-897(-)